MTQLDDALDFMASLRLEDGRRWGEVAAPFQIADATAILDPNGPPLAFLTRARGASKTSDVAGVALARMWTRPSIRCYGVAADADQARLLLDSVEGFVSRSPTLRDAFEVQQWRVVCRSNGSMLEVLASDSASSWGLRPDLVVVDEVSAWGSTAGPKKMWESVSSSVAKMPGAKLVAICTSGAPSHWSKGILDHAIADPMWYVNQVDGPAPWADSERLAEQRRRLPESTYARLFLNRWTQPEDMLARDEDIAAAAVLDGPLEPKRGRVYRIGLDVGISHDRTVAAIAHAEPVEGSPDDRRVVLDRMQVWSGSRTNPVQLRVVEEWLHQAARTYNAAQIIADPWQAVGLCQRLRAAGCRVSEFAFSSSSVGRLASTLHLLLRERLLSLPDEEALLDELRAVRLKETATGVVRLDHDPGKHDDRAIALALAATSLLERPARRAHHAVPIGLHRPSPWNDGYESSSGHVASSDHWGQAPRDGERAAYGWGSPTDNRAEDGW